MSLLNCLRTCVLALVILLPALAAAELREGTDYQIVQPAQPAEATGKIEVIEFFWYGCPHCYALEPVLGKWLKAAPKDVAFRRIPADFGRWAAGVKLFYALEALGEEERLRAAVFDAIHVDRLSYTREAEVADWLAKKGVDKDKFLAAYRSVAVTALAQRARQLSDIYGADGVPTLVVGGKYRAAPLSVGGHEALLAVVDELIAKVRAEQPGKR